MAAGRFAEVYRTAPSRGSRAGMRGASRARSTTRPVTLLMVAIALGTAGFLFTKTSVELAPEEDQGALSGHHQRRRNTRPPTIRSLRRPVRRARQGHPGARRQLPRSSASTAAAAAFFGFKLKEWSERTARRARQSSRRSRTVSNRMAGVQAFVVRACPPCRARAAACRSSMVSCRPIGDPSQVVRGG